MPGRRSGPLDKYVAAYICAIVLSAFGQALLKLGSVRTRDASFLAGLLHLHSLSGYALFFVATILSTFGLSRMPLKYGAALLPLGYVLVGALSYLFFHERLAVRQLVGALVIVSGIIVFNVK